MMQLRIRLQRLESNATPKLYTGCVRIIQDGELTADQREQIENAEAQGMMVILRVLV